MLAGAVEDPVWAFFGREIIKKKKKTIGGGCDLPAEAYIGNWPSIGQLGSGVCLCLPLN